MQTAGSTQFLVGNGAHTDQHQVRLLLDAPVKRDFARRWRAAHQQLSDRLVETKAHSSIGMVALKKGGDGLARDPRQHPILTLNNHHGGTASSRRGGPFQSDIAGTDDEHSLARLQRLS